MKKILVWLTLALMLAACRANSTPAAPTQTAAPVATRQPAKISTVAPFMESGLQLVSQAEISALTWQWAAYSESDPTQQTALTEPEKYSLVFWDDGNVSVQADCNGGQGTFQIDGDQISFGPIATTLMQCPPESQADRFLAGLGQAQTFGMAKDQLVLVLGDDAGRMYFVNAGPAQKADVVYETDFFVGPQRVECDAGAGERTCYQVKETLQSEWQLFYEEISGFDWEEGFVYHVQVKVTEILNPPADASALRYELVEVLSQTPFDQVNFTGLDLATFGLDLQGLPYRYEANLVPASTFKPWPGGALGLPQHVQVNFIARDADSTQPGDPILYVIPVQAYQSLWDGQGDPAVSDALAAWGMLLAEQASLPTEGLLALPFEHVLGPTDLTVQGQVLDFYKASGVRFVGRFSSPAQAALPVTNEDLYYVFQGFSQDGNYFLSFFYPLSAQGLPNRIGDVSADEQGRLTLDADAYLAERIQFLSNLIDDDWIPKLSLLDTVLSSLTFVSVFDDPARPTPSPTQSLGDPALP